MSRVGYDPMKGRIKTDVRGVVIDRAFLAHFQVPAAKAPAASNTAVLAAVNLTTEEQVISTGITSPGVPRGLRIKGSASGITGDVVIPGTNYANEPITEIIALNGANVVDGVKAFKTVGPITLPAESHTSAAQVETATAAGTVTTAGNASVVVTCTGMTGTPKTIAVAVAEGDDANAIAGKIRVALAADTAVTALFNVSGDDDEIILTRKTRAANIANLNIAIADGTSVGVTTAASSADTVAGVAYDTVSVGFSDILGLPYKLTHNTVIPGMTFLDNARESTEPTVVTNVDEIEKNTIDLNSALAGKVVDTYLVV